MDKGARMGPPPAARPSQNERSGRVSGVLTLTTCTCHASRLRRHRRKLSSDHLAASSSATHRSRPARHYHRLLRLAAVTMPAAWDAYLGLSDAERALPERIATVVPALLSSESFSGWLRVAEGQSKRRRTRANLPGAGRSTERGC